MKKLLLCLLRGMFRERGSGSSDADGCGRSYRCCHGDAGFIRNKGARGKRIHRSHRG